MKCKNAVDEYLKLERVSQMPLLLKIHILFCRECRKETSRLGGFFNLLRNDSLYKSSYDISSSVMDIIRRESVFPAKTISGLKWVSIGSIIFLSILLINFSESFVWLKKEFGSDYTLPMSLVMGFIVTAYVTILVGCNYENIKKYMDLHLKWKIK